MGLSRPLGDFANEFNSVYKITLDLSGWDRTDINVIPPFSGVINVYGSNDGGAVQGVTQGNATLAINFTPVEVTNLATHAVTNSISAAGNYRYDVNAQFLRIQGVPPAAGTNVYKLLLFNSKIS
ncbi:MAG: hypothetical protein V4538_15210 [Bacteroidota bacterium]